MAIVRLRDRLWTVEQQTEVGDRRTLFKLRDLSTGEPADALCPPERFDAVANIGPTLDPHAVAPYGIWHRKHEAIRLASTAGVPLVSTHAGRILPEAYQFVPAARLLSMPRPSLLIADDVGLGKTIEAGICLMELLARGRARRILLVVPPGLIPQWRDEMMEKFGLAFHTIENAAGLDRAQTNLAEGLKPWGFLERVITSVDYIKRRDVTAKALERPWDVIIVDEAHALAESGSPMNPYATHRTRLGQRLRDGCRCLLLLTATPHNGYRHSFRSLIELVSPTDATFEGAQDVLQRRVTRSMVRRMKCQIHRTDAAGVPRPAFQPREPVRGIAVGDVSAEDREIFRLVSGYCAKVANAAAGTEQEDLVSFAMQIVKKRMLSSRTALANTVKHRLEAITARGEPEEPPSRSEIRELQSDLPLGEAEHERLARRLVRSAIPVEARRRNDEKKKLKAIVDRVDKCATLPDAKFAALAEELRAKVMPIAGEKAIIFTEYVDTLQALATYLGGLPGFTNTTVTLRGGISVRQRLAALKRFADPDIRFLLATDAASEGLNLQHHCCRIYHLELPWNPVRLEQRNGRVDRHGQRRRPQIAYFHYPDSPEDRVLDRLIQRIDRMQSDQVSTPDTLGLLSEGRIERALGELDAEESESANNERTATLFRLFDEDQTRFVRELSPLLTLRDNTSYGNEVNDPSSANPLVGDDAAHERLMRDTLGQHLQPTPVEGVFSLQTPPALQGPGVADRYGALTFRRSIAVERPTDEVEFVHRFHPLAQAVFGDAWRALTLPLVDGRAGERLAVRRHAAAKSAGPYALFTFAASHRPPDGTFLSVAVAADGTVLDEAYAALAMDLSSPAGEVPWSSVERVFPTVFGHLAQTAARIATEQLADILNQRKKGRELNAVLLREDAAQYRTDRLQEIDREEKAAETGDERGQGGQRQMVFFDQRETYGFKARRAAVDTFHGKRMADIEAFVQGDVPPPLHPLGVLLVFPADSK